MKEKTHPIFHRKCVGVVENVRESMYQSFTDTRKEKRNNRKPGTTVLLKNFKATDKTVGFAWIACETVSWAQVVSTEFQSE